MVVRTGTHVSHASAKPMKIALSFPTSVKCKLNLAFWKSCVVAALFPDNATVLDANDPVGKRQNTRIMGNHQNRPVWILGNAGKDGHDRMAVLAVQSRRRLISQNS